MTKFRHDAGMRSYLAVRKFIDWDLSSTGYIRSGSWSLLIAVLLACGPLPFIDRPYSPGDLAAIVGAILASIFWLSFVAWRGIRMFRAVSIRRDRRYDRTDKHLLSSDYRATGSATKAGCRR